jgi:hypothetical protein
MFFWASPTSKKTKKPKKSHSVPRRISLQLEALEARYCLSASAPAPLASEGVAQADTVSGQDLAITLSVTAGPGTATVSGQVTGDAFNGGLTVTFTGVVSGSVTTNADGTFSFTATASSLGQIQASVMDAVGNTATSSVNFNSIPPTIVNFRAINNGNNIWTFTGQVQGPYVAGLVVTLRGIPSLNSNSASATVEANGTFSYTIGLQPGESGPVTAECIDWWGQASNEATNYVLG